LLGSLGVWREAVASMNFHGGGRGKEVKGNSLG